MSWSNATCPCGAAPGIVTRSAEWPFQLIVTRFMLPTSITYHDTNRRSYLLEDSREVRDHLGQWP